MEKFFSKKMKKIEKKNIEKLKKTLKKGGKKVEKRWKKVEKKVKEKNSLKLNPALWLNLYFWARLIFTMVVSWRILSAGFKT